MKTLLEYLEANTPVGPTDTRTVDEGDPVITTMVDPKSNPLKEGQLAENSPDIAAWSHEKQYYIVGPYQEGFFAALDDLDTNSMYGFSESERKSFLAGYVAGKRYNHTLHKMNEGVATRWTRNDFFKWLIQNIEPSLFKRLQIQRLDTHLSVRGAPKDVEQISNLAAANGLNTNIMPNMPSFNQSTLRIGNFA